MDVKTTSNRRCPVVSLCGTSRGVGGRARLVSESQRPLCGVYKLDKQDPRFGRLVTPTKDSAIAQYVADFNAATGTNDEGGLALLALVGYCNAHVMTKLGDVTAKIVREDFAAKQGSMIQPEPAESLTLKAWYEQSLSICASSDECRRMVKKTYDDSVACSVVDRSACSCSGR